MVDTEAKQGLWAVDVASATSSSEGSPQAFTKRRRRKWAPKVKTGCATCRTRHVKCDELRPSCRQCTRQGLVCGGIGYGTTPQSKRIVIKASRYSSMVCQPEDRNFPSQILPRPLERELFSYFRSQAAPLIGGAFDHEFWQGCLLRSAKVYPAIWHLCVALAATHTSPVMRCIAGDTQNPAIRDLSGGSLSPFSLEMYQLALRDLIASSKKGEMLSDTDKEMFLTANLLAAIVCKLGRNIAQSWTHIENGLRLFHHWQLWRPERQSAAGGLVSMKSITAIYCRLDAQTIFARYPKWPIRKWTQVLDEAPKCAAFKTPTDIYYELEILNNGFWGLSYMDGYQNDVDQRESAQRWLPYQKHYLSFKVRLANFMSSLKQKTYLSNREIQAIKVIRARVLFLEIAESVDKLAGEMRYDHLEDDCMTVLDLAEELLDLNINSSTAQDAGTPESSSSSSSSQASQHGYSFSPALTEPLHGMVRICRNPVIRRRALQLMKRSPAMEGIQDVAFLVSLLEGNIKFEEAAWLEEDENDPHVVKDCECIPGSFICNGHRIADQLLLPSNDPTIRGDTYVRTVEDKKLGRPWRRFGIPY